MRIGLSVARPTYVLTRFGIEPQFTPKRSLSAPAVLLLEPNLPSPLFAERLLPSTQNFGLLFEEENALMF